MTSPHTLRPVDGPFSVNNTKTNGNGNTMRHYEAKTTVDRRLTRITCSVCEVQRTFALPDEWVTINWPCVTDLDKPDDWSIDLCPGCASSLLPNLASLKPTPTDATANP